jgi:hypothetical protein
MILTNKNFQSRRFMRTLEAGIFGVTPRRECLFSIAENYFAANRRTATFVYRKTGFFPAATNDTHP